MTNLNITWTEGFIIEPVTQRYRANNGTRDHVGCQAETVVESNSPHQQVKDQTLALLFLFNRHSPYQAMDK